MTIAPESFYKTWAAFHPIKHPRLTPDGEFIKPAPKKVDLYCYETLEPEEKQESQEEPKAGENMVNF